MHGAALGRSQIRSTRPSILNKSKWTKLKVQDSNYRNSGGKSCAKDQELKGRSMEKTGAVHGVSELKDAA